MLDSEDSFFEEIQIIVEVENIGKLRLFMRPLKVKEIPLACRVSALRTDGDEEGEYLPALIDLVQGCVDKDITELPMTCIDEITAAFLNLNFPEDEKAAKKKGKPKIQRPSELAAVFDFLVQQGHTYHDILEYTLPQIELLQEVAVERLSGVKRVDPITALTGAGVAYKG